MPQLIGHPRGVLVQMQIGGHEDFERSGGALRLRWVDQHVVERSVAGLVDEFDLSHPDLIQSIREDGLGAGNYAETYDYTQKASEEIACQTNEPRVKDQSAERA